MVIPGIREMPKLSHMFKKLEGLLARIWKAIALLRAGGFGQLIPPSSLGVTAG